MAAQRESGLISETCSVDVPSVLHASYMSQPPELLFLVYPLEYSSLSGNYRVSLSLIMIDRVRYLLVDVVTR